MNFYASYLQRAMEESGVQPEQLNASEVSNLTETIAGRFPSRAGSDALWERFKDVASKRRSDATEVIFEYVSANPVILFFNEWEHVPTFRFNSGADLRRLLNSCPPLEFYITDEPASYVLCRNHHDYVIGVGKCKAWIDGLEEKWD